MPRSINIVTEEPASDLRRYFKIGGVKVPMLSRTTSQPDKRTIFVRRLTAGTRLVYTTVSLFSIRASAIQSKCPKQVFTNNNPSQWRNKHGNSRVRRLGKQARLLRRFPNASKIGTNQTNFHRSLHLQQILRISNREGLNPKF